MSRALHRTCMMDWYCRWFRRMFSRLRPMTRPMDSSSLWSWRSDARREPLSRVHPGQEGGFGPEVGAGQLERQIAGPAEVEYGAELKGDEVRIGALLAK